MSDTHELKFRVGNFRYPVSVTVEGKKLRLNFAYNAALIAEIKNMGGARWSPEARCWTVENNPRNLFTIQFFTEKNPYAPYDAELIPFTPRRTICMKHQVTMSSHICTRRQCICAYEMGSGKTLAAMEAMEASGHDDWFWVAPKSALYSVKLEFERWKICDICKLPKKALIVQGETLMEAHKDDHLWLTGKCVQPRYYTYENLRKLVDEWPEGKVPPKGIIFDESSRAKTPTAQRTQAALILTSMMRAHWGKEAWIVLMSGTPAPKSPLDWWAQCEIACPGFLREGDIRKMQKRMAVIEERQSITGGMYPHHVCWRDSDKRCEVCGQMQDSGKHDTMMGGHKFIPCTDEVSKLYKRMNGLVLVAFKKDCLDLPEKVYRTEVLAPSNEMLRAASLINAKSPSAIQALTLLRELSDGFQYRETEVGMQECTICKGSRVMLETVDLNDPDNPIDGLSAEYGFRVEYDDAGTPTLTDRKIEIGKRKIACAACDGTGEVIRLSRSQVEMKSPKEDLLIELLDQHEDIGRLVVYGGFTGTIDKITNVVKQQKWDYIRVDGRGWDCSLKGYHPLRMLEAFQGNEHQKICFIGQPSSAGMGLNLTASPTIFYYSNDFNAESRSQSEDRIHRPGMNVNRGATIIDCVVLPSDMLIINNLKRKKRLQDMTLGVMREEIAAIKFSEVRNF